MRKHLQLAAMFLLLGPVALCQVEPAATSPSLPLPGGNFQYSLRYAQTAEFGRGLGNWQNGVVSGSLNYTNGRERFPFSMGYGGGYNFSIAGPSYGNGVFQHLSLTQGMVGRKWHILLNNDVNYSPEAPTLGFTGIPGIGEPVTPPPPTGSQSILTLNTHVVDNSSMASISRPLNYAWGMDMGGSYNMLRFPDGNGLNTGTAGANGGLHYRLSARNSLTGNYIFSKFTYPAFGFSFFMHSGMFGFSRRWSRRLSSNVSIGPEWTSSSDATVVPSSRHFAMNATASYQAGFNTIGVTYARGVNGGGGYLIGSETDTAAANYSRRFGQQTSLGFNASYMRTAGLVNNGVTAAKYGSAQVSRRLGPFLSLFANYSLISQSSSSVLPGNTLAQTIQVLGFGIEYSPRQKEQPAQ